MVDPTLQKFRVEAAAVRPICLTPVARQFLDQVAELPTPKARPLFYRTSDRQLATSAAEGFEPYALTTRMYYETKYGTPLAYSRVLEAAGRHGFVNLAGKRVMDFGYGSVGHLRLMSLAKAETVGVDVDPFLAALYSHPSDQEGGIKLIHGSWPGDAAISTAAGGGYDLISSKNTLKRGYVHPERKVDPRMLVNLGVSDEQFLSSVFKALRPGGYFVVYNLSPAQERDPEKWIPWADGRCAFTRAQLTKAGFRVLDYDRKEDDLVAKMAVAFEWANSESEARKSFFSHVTVCRRPG